MNQNAEKFFREMYHYIWQSHDISRLDDFYAKDFEETITVADTHQQPIELRMHYAEIAKQAKWQKETYRDTTIDIKKLVATDDHHIAVNFTSTSVVKKTGETHYRCVCGIWRLNKENKINRVWAVVTPYYP